MQSQVFRDAIVGAQLHGNKIDIEIKEHATASTTVDLYTPKRHLS